MRIENELNKFYETYETPRIDKLIVGFSGIDPIPKSNHPTDVGTSGVSMTEVSSYVSQELSGLRVELRAYSDNKVTTNTRELKEYVDTQATTKTTELKTYIESQTATNTLELKEYFDSQTTTKTTELKRYIESYFSDQLTIKSAELKEYINEKTLALETKIVSELKEYVIERINDTDNPPTQEELESYIAEYVHRVITSDTVALKDDVDARLEALKASLEQEIATNRAGALSDMKEYLTQATTRLNGGEIE